MEGKKIIKPINLMANSLSSTHTHKETMNARRQVDAVEMVDQHKCSSDRNRPKAEPSIGSGPQAKRRYAYIRVIKRSPRNLFSSSGESREYINQSVKQIEARAHRISLQVFVPPARGFTLGRPAGWHSRS